MKGFGNKEIKTRLTVKDIVKAKLINQAHEYYQKGDIYSSLQCFESCIKKGIHDPKMISEYGIILYQTGSEDKAINIFEQAIINYPKNPDLFTNLSNIYKFRGDLIKAENYIYKSYDLNPKSIIVLNNLTSILIIRKKFYEAEKYAVLSLKIDKTNSDSLYNLGVIYSNIHHYQEAIIYFKESIKFNEKNYSANLNLGAVLLKLNRFDESIKYLNISLKLNPESYEAYFNLGQLCLYTNKLGDSEKYLQKSLSICKNDDEVYKYLGIVQFINFNKNASSNLQKAIELNPSKNISHVLNSVIKLNENSNQSKAPFYINPYDSFGEKPIILYRQVTEDLINTLYKRNTSDLNKIDNNPHSGNAIGSDYFLFKDNDPILNTLQDDLKGITSEYFNSDIFIEDAFFRILKGKGQVEKHMHIGIIDKLKRLNLYKHKFSLVYYLKTGDDNCSEPGYLTFYDPEDKVLPKPGMIILFPSDRPHSVLYNGKSDRMILSINFYSY